MAKIDITKAELVWPGKYNNDNMEAAGLVSRTKKVRGCSENQDHQYRLQASR